MLNGYGQMPTGHAKTSSPISLFSAGRGFPNSLIAFDNHVRTICAAYPGFRTLNLGHLVIDCSGRQASQALRKHEEEPRFIRLVQVLDLFFREPDIDGIYHNID